MINPKELRIGNIIWESNSFTPGPEDYNEIIVASINDIDKVVRDEQGNGYSYDALYGIPLTPEWMEKMGFKSEQFENGYPFERIFTKEIPSEFSQFRKLEILYSDVNPRHEYRFYSHGIEILHVHDLQNLYFPLTGEELKMKN